MKENLSITKGLLYSLIYVLFVTLAAYPGLAMHTQIKLLNGVPNATNWLAIYIQIVYNGFDTIGRYAGGMHTLDLSIKYVNLGSLLRTIFVLTFLAIALGWGP